MPDVNPTTTRERLLRLLKTRGPATAPRLAASLSVTPVAVRQHLALLADEGLVTSEAPPARGSVGRPARSWRLTSQGHALFPEGYADLALDLIETLESSLGPSALETFLAHRLEKQVERYRARLPRASTPLPERVRALARLRTEEGYLARSRKERDGSVRLFEDHCPVCAAAEVCQGLCTNEQRLFERVLGPRVRVEREQHLFSGDRHCVWRFRNA
ncbi:MAG TPA: ArsR family transcriptional regulator [Planctomycetes bacterium]|nr:ArsR family transcriptional regulator [Planctomycetota bacterium]